MGEWLGGVDYLGHTKAELYARDLGVDGPSKTDKLELAWAIDRTQGRVRFPPVSSPGAPRAG